MRLNCSNGWVFQVVIFVKEELIITICWIFWMVSPKFIWSELEIECHVFQSSKIYIVVGIVYKYVVCPFKL